MWRMECRKSETRRRAVDDSTVRWGRHALASERLPTGGSGRMLSIYGTCVVFVQGAHTAPMYGLIVFLFPLRPMALFMYVLIL